LAVSVAALILACVSSAEAGSASDALVFTGCIANQGADGCDRPAHDSLGGAALAVSADGRSVYATGGRSAVNRLSRSKSGELTYRGCMANSKADGCHKADHRSLIYDNDVALAPNGRTIYATGFYGSLTKLRLSSTGRLRYGSCIMDYGAMRCRKSQQGMLDGADGVAVSPDGRSVYVASEIFGTVSSFRIASNGAIERTGCMTSLPLVDCRRPNHGSLDGAEGIAVSPDGRWVYVVSFDSRSVTWFQRTKRGKLIYRGCIANRGANGCEPTARLSLSGASNLAVSPDGNTVYVTAGYSDAVTWLTKRADGGLRWGGCMADRGHRRCQAPPLDSLGAPYGVAVSPDGNSVYVTSPGSDSLTRFHPTRRGGLRFEGCTANEGRNGCDEPRHPSLDAPLGVAVSPDSRSVYVNSVGHSSKAISSFRLGPAP
jgi:DNA-binding beta-propeller fold protein YncE